MTEQTTSIRLEMPSSKWTAFRVWCLQNQVTVKEGLLALMEPRIKEVRKHEKRK